MHLTDAELLIEEFSKSKQRAEALEARSLLLSNFAPMKQLEALIDELEVLIPQHTRVKMAVSQASVGWHIEHSMLVFNGILSALIKSDPHTYRWKWNLRRTLVFTKGKIPRGRGRAPKTVVPKEVFDEDNIRSLLANIRGYLPKLEALSERHHFKHPIFDQLNKKKTLYFIGLHTRHHLMIIREILEESK